MFTGVYIISLISVQNIGCGYSFGPPRRGGSNEYHNLCFEQKYENIRFCLSEHLPFLAVKLSIYLNKRVFVMITIPLALISTPESFKMFLYKIRKITECYMPIVELQCR